MEGWNSKLNKLTGKREPNVHLVVQTLKKKAEKNITFVESETIRRTSNEMEENEKRLKRIRNIIFEFERNKNIGKCLKALGFVTKFE